MSQPSYSSVYYLADEAAVTGQRSHLWLLRLELGIVILGAGLGAIDEQASIIGAAAAFIVAIVLRSTRMASHPVADWQEGRAAAESVKTLCWRYAVCARPFERALADAEADRLFVERLGETLGQVARLNLVPAPETDEEQVTDWMRAERAQSLDGRQETYRSLRIDDQRSWYRAKAQAARTSSRRWSLAVLLLECTGAALAVLSLSDAVVGNDRSPAGLLGIVAALVAAATAWTQARQFGGLASGYTIAHQELGAIRGLMTSALDEGDWSAFVDSAEGAISREHTMWRGSRFRVPL